MTRSIVLVLAAALAFGSLVLVAPSAGAVDVCTSATGNCSGWIVCVGAHRGTGGYVQSCQYGIQGPSCDPGPCPATETSSPVVTSYCSSATDGGSCPYMLCVGPHYNQWGTVSWCSMGLYWPCQYCVPLGPIESAPSLTLP